MTDEVEGGQLGDFLPVENRKSDLGEPNQAGGVEEEGPKNPKNATQLTGDPGVGPQIEDVMKRLGLSNPGSQSAETVAPLPLPDNQTETVKQKSWIARIFESIIIFFRNLFK